jgi:hypothetical protein
MKTQLLLTVFLGFTLFYSFSQELPLPKSIQSPNTASLGKYGDVPVSYYNGSPSVDIPLYQINDYGIPLSISLNYNASGVRVNNMPSWVGQNWSLQAGGVITRTVKDAPDETYLPIGTSQDPQPYLGDYQGYYFSVSHDMLDVPNWHENSYLWTLYSNSFFNNNIGNTHGREYQPDIFTFNFMGHTGKFFLSEKGEWKVSSSSNLEVVIDPNDFEYPFDEDHVPFNNHDPSASYYNFPAPDPASKNIHTIKLIDDQGNTFTFGNTDNSVEYTIPMYSQQSTKWIANSWYLTKVEDRFGKSIYTFEYEREGYIPSFYRYRNHNTFNSVDNDVQFFGIDYSCYSTNSNNFEYSGDLISSVYLNKITTYHGDITLNRTLSNGKSYLEDPNISQIFHGPGSAFMPPSNYEFYFYLLPYTNWQDIANKLRNWQKLVSISGLNKQINLSFNDTSSNPSNNDRLNLESVQIDNKTYDLEYYNFNELPHYLSTEVDHWGYYDGSPWVVTHPNYASHYASRATHATNVKKGMIKKFIYPTKGWTEFEWEANNYSSYVSDDKSQLITGSNTLAGGVRIAKIKDHDGSNYVLTKDYKYVKGYVANPSSTTSSGILENKPKHYWVNFQTKVSNQPNVVLKENIFSTNPILPLANSSGSHIGYSEVVEIFSNGGYNIFKFHSNEDSNYRDEFTSIDANPDPSPYTSFSDRSLLRGMLAEVINFNAAGQKLKSTTKTYDHDNAKYIKSLHLDLVGCSYAFAHGFLKANAQKLFYFDNNLIKEKTISFENGEQISQETDYNWSYYPSNSNTFGDQFLKSKRIQTFLEQGEANQEYYEEFYHYPFDNSNATNTQLLSERLFPLLKTETFKNNTKIKTNEIEYSYFNSKLFIKKNQTSIGSNPLEESIIIDSYDTNDYLIEKYHQKDGTYTIIAYKDLLPLVKLEGADLSSTSYLDSKVSQMSQTGKTQAEIIILQQDVRNYYSDHMVTSYTFDPLIGVTSITDQRGYTTYFEYDNYERLAFERDDNGKIIKQYSYNYKQ